MYRFIAPLFVPSVVLALSAAYYMESVNVDPIDKILIKPVCLSILAFYLYFIAVEYVRYKKRFQVPCKEGGADCHTKIKIPYKEMLIIGMTALYVWICSHKYFFHGGNALYPQCAQTLGSLLFFCRQFRHFIYCI